MVFVIVIYAGILFMTTAANPEGHSQARKMLLNAVLGFVIVLAAWLVVDFVMKAFYNPDDSGFGPWNQILTGGGDYCITAKPSVPLFTGGIAGSFTVPGGAPSGGYATNVGKAGALCADGNPACSVAALKALGLSDAQAKTMSCIAVTESSGNPRTPDSNTGACGTFQITTRPGNWSIAKYHQPPCSAATSCNNAACNLQTAVLMFKEQSYQPWTGINPKTGQHWNPNAVACMNKYDPGHPGR
jgi:hypothetical protein